METIRALVKGETGKGFKTVETFLLSDGREETFFVLFRLLSELFVGLVWASCRGASVTVAVLLSVAIEAVELCWRGYENVPGDPGVPTIGNKGESLLELIGLEERLEEDKFLSLWRDGDEDDLSTVPLPCLISLSADMSIFTLTVLLSAPTALLAVHS